MAITAEKVLEVARTQIGTKATDVKRCKYNTEYYGTEVSGGFLSMPEMLICCMVKLLTVVHSL